jgi:hypothetical protein
MILLSLPLVEIQICTTTPGLFVEMGSH